MLVSLIVAMDRNRVIGKGNDIPWRIPNDWKYVNNITSGSPIILGRKNFESIGRALPNRRNIVLTRSNNLHIEGCEIVHSVNEVFERCKHEDEIFVFGGEQIYEIFMPYVNKMYITKIHHEFEGDTFFPEIDYGEWTETYVEKGIQNEDNPYVYYFHIYNRRNPFKKY